MNFVGFLDRYGLKDIGKTIYKINKGIEDIKIFNPEEFVNSLFEV